MFKAPFSLFTPCALATAIAVTSVQVSAEQIPTAATENVIVTATKTEQSIDQTLAQVEVITREEIAALQVTDMTELLKRMTSVNVRTSGGLGTVTSLSLRGTNSDHTLVLVDGVRIASVTSGSAALQHIDPNSIERIEIVRGARSSLYGSEAIGGVLQIFTNKQADTSQVNLRATGGSNNTKDVNVRASLSKDNYWLNGQVSHLETDGYDRTIDESFANDDKDAYENTTVSLAGGLNVSDQAKLGLNYQITEGRTEYDQNCAEFGADWSRIDYPCRPLSDFSLEVISFDLDSQWSNAFNTELNLGQSKDESQIGDYILPRGSDISGSDNYFNTTRKNIDFQGNYKFTDRNTLTLGVNYYDDQLDSNVDFGTVNSSGQIESVNNRDNLGTFAQYQVEFSEHSLVIGARNDDNEQYGSKNTGSASWGWDITSDIKSIVSWGTAFKAPTYNDLYWPFQGNPELNPETSENIEVGLRTTLNDWSIDVAVFRNDIDNLIAWAPGEDGIWAPTNINRSKLLGFETSASGQGLGFNWKANYTYINSENKSSKKDLIYRPEHSTTIDLDKNWNALYVGATISAQSSVYTDGSNDSELAGFGIVDLRTGYQLNEQFLLQLKATNLFDKNYVTREGYREEGIGGQISLTYSL